MDENTLELLVLNAVSAAMAGYMTEGTGDSDEPGDNNVNQANAPEVKPEVKREVKPEVKPGVEQLKLNGAGQSITVRVKDVDGSLPLFVTMKTTHKLHRLMNAYCDKMNVDPSTIVFIFDGRRIHGNHTPEDHEMEDGDEIDVFLHSMGG